MIYTKHQFGKELEKQIQLKYDVQKLSNWAYSIYLEHCNVFEPGLKEEILNFLNEICIIGICIHDSESLNYLLSKEYYEVDDFVTEIFYLASISPETNLSLFRDAKKKFIDKFGCSEICIKKQA